MEFIYQAFELYKVGKVTTNLDIMTRRFNEVRANGMMLWTCVVHISMSAHG